MKTCRLWLVVWGVLLLQGQHLCAAAAPEAEDKEQEAKHEEGEREEKEEHGQMGAQDLPAQGVEALQADLTVFVHNNIPNIKNQIFIPRFQVTAADVQRLDIAILNQFKEKLRLLHEADWPQEGEPQEGVPAQQDPGLVWVENTLPVVRDVLAKSVEEQYGLKGVENPIDLPEFQRLAHEFATSLSFLSPGLKQAYDANSVKNLLFILVPLSLQTRLGILIAINKVLVAAWRYVIYVQDLPVNLDKKNFLESVKKTLLNLASNDAKRISPLMSEKYNNELPLSMDIQGLDAYKQVSMYSDLQSIVLTASILAELGQPFVVPLQFQAANRPASIEEVKMVAAQLQKMVFARTRQITSSYAFNFNDLNGITATGLEAQLRAIGVKLSPAKSLSMPVPVSVGEDLAVFKQKIESQAGAILKHIETALIEGLRLSLYGWSQRFDELLYGKLVVWFDEALSITQRLLGANAQQVRVQPGARPQPVPGAAARPPAQPLPPRAAQKSPVPAPPGAAAPGRPGPLPVPDDGGPAVRQGQAGPAIPGVPPFVAPPVHVPLPALPAAPAAARSTPTGNAQKIQDVVQKLKKIIQQKNDILLQRGPWDRVAKEQRLAELKKQAKGLEEQRAKLQREKDAAWEFIADAGLVRAAVSTINADFAQIAQDVEILPAQSALGWIGSWRIWPWNWWR
jgi:hypothetical protein